MAPPFSVDFRLVHRKSSIAIASLMSISKHRIAITELVMFNLRKCTKVDH